MEEYDLADADFWALVDMSGGPDSCWPWLGERWRCDNGYGKVIVNGKPKGAHRHAYEVTHGPAGDLHVCHSCDNRICCNTSHLFKGTAQANALDKVIKGRHRNRSGSRSVALPPHYCEQIIILYKIGQPIDSLASMYGVSEAVIRYLVSA